MIPEFLRHVVVHERIHAAVETGQAQRGDVEAVAVVSQTISQEGVMYDHHHVTGNKADQECDEHRYDEENGTLAAFSGTAFHPRGPERSKEEDVSYDYDHHRDKEHQSCHHHEVVVGLLDIQERIVLNEVLLADNVHVMAGGDV